MRRFQGHIREGNSIYSYSDLKASVLVEFQGYSMVCEVQFLVKWMLESKKKGHAIYEVVRMEEFIANVNTLNNIFSNAGDECLALAQRKDTKKLAKFIVNNPAYELFPKAESEDSLPFIMASNDNIKGLQLLLSTVKDDKERLRIMKQSDGKGSTPILNAMRHGSKRVFEVYSSFSSLSSIRPVSQPSPSSLHSISRKRLDLQPPP